MHYDNTYINIHTIYFSSLYILQKLTKVTNFLIQINYANFSKIISWKNALARIISTILNNSTTTCLVRLTLLHKSCPIANLANYLLNISNYVYKHPAKLQCTMCGYPIYHMYLLLLNLQIQKCLKYQSGPKNCIPPHPLQKRHEIVCPTFRSNW